jgi:hypothetical protein
MGNLLIGSCFDRVDEIAIWSPFRAWRCPAPERSGNNPHRAARCVERWSALQAEPRSGAGRDAPPLLGCGNASVSSCGSHFTVASLELRHPRSQYQCRPPSAYIGNESIFELRPYGFGERRFALLALLTFITLSGWRSCGVVITKFSGHAVTLRSSPTVFADTLTSRSTSTRIVAGKPPRATWSAAMLLGLYRICAPFCRIPDRWLPQSNQDWSAHP